MSATTRGDGPVPGQFRTALRLTGLLVLMAATALYDLDALTTPAAKRYEADFDASVAHREPAVAAILASDPALRATMLRETEESFEAGGWPAATVRYQNLKRSMIQIFAGDRATLACAAAWTQIIRDLLPTPSLCRAYLSGDYSDPRVAQAMTVADAPCAAAIVDAGQRRAAGNDAKLMAADEYAATYRHTLEGPSALSAQDQAVLQNPAPDDRLLCQASLKLHENWLALPPDQAGRFARTQLTMPSYPVALAIEELEKPPPAGLVYAAPGTIFTLSTEARDGKPITWMSLGQNGWDLRLKSSATGYRGLWGDDRSNPLRLLWPLAVGKTADVTSMTDSDAAETHHYSVVSNGRYWLPVGWVTAYAIDDSVSIGGRVRYVMTHYWSPELCFKIGQRTVVKSGAWPDNTAPDWQVIAVEKPG